MMILDSAARSGNLNWLQWARQNGCDWDSYTCYTAASNHHRHHHHHHHHHHSHSHSHNHNHEFMNFDISITSISGIILIFSNAIQRPYIDPIVINDMIINENHCLLLTSFESLSL